MHIHACGLGFCLWQRCSPKTLSRQTAPSSMLGALLQTLVWKCREMQPRFAKKIAGSLSRACATVWHIYGNSTSVLLIEYMQADCEQQVLTYRRASLQE